jgi:hypothetical protein
LRRGRRRGSAHETQLWAAGRRRGEGAVGAERLTQGQANDEVDDRLCRGKQVRVEIAAGGVGRVAVQADAPARFFVPGREDRRGPFGM